MEELLNLKDIMKILGLSNVTIYKLIHEGKLKAYKIGNSLRFKGKDIEAMIQSGSFLANLKKRNEKTKSQSQKTD